MTNGIINTNDKQNQMTEYVLIYVPHEDEELEVEFLVEGSYGNHGIGGYEWWGHYERDDDWRWEIDDITWRTEDFRPWENETIAKYVEDNYMYIEEQFLKQVDEYQPEPPDLD